MYKSNILVEHIASFTSQRDMEMLTLSLLKSIRSMLSSDRASIIAVNKQGKVTSQMIYEGELYVHRDNNFKFETELLNAFELMQATSSKEHTLNKELGCSTILLLESNRLQEKYLVIELTERMGKGESLIMSGILSIYNNFVSLLLESQTDELTGLANRKTFESAIKKVFDMLPLSPKAIEAERRKGLTSWDVKSESEADLYWLAIIDIDHFKAVNDNFGHLYGDEILIHLAQLIRSSFRTEDLQFRFGGEEFVILLQAPGIEMCRQILERFRVEVANYKFPRVENVTVSIGVVGFRKEVFHVTSIDYADQALYHSKQNGRNQVTFFEDMLDAGLAEVKHVEGGDVDLF